MTDLTQQHRQARIDSPLGEDVIQLQHFRGRETLSRGFHYDLTVVSDDTGISGQSIVGKRISVTYFNEDGRQRVFNGFVSRFSYVQQVDLPKPRATYHLEMVPWLWFLKHNRDCQIFQEMSAPDIIKQIFNERGFSDFRIELSGSYPSREYCVQYRESDFQFVSRLMEEEGIFYFFEHNKDNHTLVLADSTSAYAELDEPEVRYTPIGQKHVEQLSSWQHVYEFRPGKVARKDFNFKTPSDDLVTDTNSMVKFDNSSALEIYDYPGLYVEPENGERLTKVRTQELEAEHDFVDGSGYYLSFSPGGRFKVSDHIRPGEKGKSYVLIDVHTEFNSNIGLNNEVTVDFQNQFRCIPAETIFRPLRSTEKPLVEGPQTAIVVTDGQEIVVDEHARVKVQFHWDRYGQKDVNSSCWIRVSQHHASAEWGMIDIPRQHEEVIVSFLDGDPDRPIITGRVYNGANRPPFDLKGAGNNAKNKMRRGYITKSYEAEGYNELTMDDTAGEEQIRMHAQHNMDTVVLNDSKAKIFHNKHQIIGDDKDGKVGDQKELVWQDKQINVKRHQVEHIEGNAQMMVGNGDADTGGKLEIVVENQELRQIGDGGLHVDVTGHHLERVGGKYNLDVQGDMMHKCSGNAGMETGSMGQVHLKGGTKFVVEVGPAGQLSLNGPGGFIMIDAMGVTISGTMVKINSGGAKASGGGISVDAPETAEPAAPQEPELADRFR
ncbi:MAG: type VI secretion system tip protein TssI/VgrG [Planctomycetota bacterium]